MTDETTAIWIEAILNQSYYTALFFSTICSIRYVNMFFQDSSFGTEVKNTIKKRHYVNLIGWLVFNLFVYVCTIFKDYDIDTTGVWYIIL